MEAFTVPYGEPNDHGNRRFVSLCRLVGDDGSVGWGEAVTIQAEAAQATTAVLRAWAPAVVGADASPAGVTLATAPLQWWYGTGGGLSGFAVAALDTAAWDLAARVAGIRVVDLLGGVAHPDGLPVLVSSHAMLADLDAEADRFATWEAGLSAVGVKVGIGKAGDADLGRDHDRDVRFMASLRRALGPGALIAIDTSARVRWTVPEAIRRVRAFEEHGLHWIEEPLGASDPDGYRRLRDATTTLIAYGEREWTVEGMVALLDSGTCDVIGIDAGRAGGVSGFVAAARHAALRRRQANAHAFAGPVSYAAGLAVSLASPACRQFEVAPLRNDLMTRLGPGVPLPTAGRVTALPGPGLGVDLDEQAVRQSAVD
jgi:L-alanine-DL-glutamate epimerase-like enolase superfamily enzyme